MQTMLIHYCTIFLDRKSTRLNSSHQIISYAVFCLKKKKNTHTARNKSTTCCFYPSLTQSPPYTLTRTGLPRMPLHTDTVLRTIPMTLGPSTTASTYPLRLDRDVARLVACHVTALSSLSLPHTHGFAPSTHCPVCVFSFLDISLLLTRPPHSSFFFFLNDPAPPEIYPFPLHAALPISLRGDHYDRGAVRFRHQSVLEHVQGAEGERQPGGIDDLGGAYRHSAAA